MLFSVFSDRKIMCKKQMEQFEKDVVFYEAETWAGSW